MIELTVKVVRPRFHITALLLTPCVRFENQAAYASALGNG